jgi:hypothetical protein
MTQVHERSVVRLDDRWLEVGNFANSTLVDRDSEIGRMLLDFTSPIEVTGVAWCLASYAGEGSTAVPVALLAGKGDLGELTTALAWLELHGWVKVAS